MPEPFKNLFSQAVIKNLGSALQKTWGAFPYQAFVQQAAKDLDKLELKQRSSQIASALEVCLPTDFRQAGELLLSVLAPEDGGEGIEGWAVMPLTQFVERRGLAEVDYSLTLLREMTKRFTAEFAIRPFLISAQQRTLRQLESWLDDPNHHVRRLISEGTRPRLPWGQRLPAFVENPSPVLPLLEALRDDPSDYVRRSVANNLNDIAKDHPDVVARLAAHWLKGASPERRRLVTHACRSLVKQGHGATLKALGYSAPLARLSGLVLETEKVVFGQALTFHITLTSFGRKAQSLVLDYAVHHQKANGALAPKVFKGAKLSLAAGETRRITRRHAFKPITTRVYHPGRHRLEILLNGQSLGIADFELMMPKV